MLRRLHVREPDDAPRDELKASTAHGRRKQSLVMNSGWSASAVASPSPPREPLVTMGRDGSSTFWMATPERGWTPEGFTRRTYRVFGDFIPVGDAPFHVAVFVEVAPGTWQPNSVACDLTLRGRGITAAVYKRLVADTGGRLRSSSPSRDHRVYHWELLTDDGRKVWESLVAHGDAWFDEAQHRYFLRDQQRK